MICTGTLGGVHDKRPGDAFQLIADSLRAMPAVREFDRDRLDDEDLLFDMPKLCDACGQKAHRVGC